MPRKQQRFLFLLVQAVSASRVVAALGFAATALTPNLQRLALFLFIYANLSDFLDGKLARQFHCVTRGGEALDNFADKYLTSISVLYAGARGVDLVICCLILVRNLLVLSLRAAGGRGEILGSTRRVGVAAAVPIRVATLCLLLFPSLPAAVLDPIFFVVAVWMLLSLAVSVRRDWSAVRNLFRSESFFS